MLCAGPGLAGEMGIHGLVAGSLEVQCAWKGAAQQQRWDANGQALPATPPMPPQPPPRKTPRPPLPLEDDQLVCFCRSDGKRFDAMR